MRVRKLAHEINEMSHTGAPTVNTARPPIHVHIYVRAALSFISVPCACSHGLMYATFEDLTNVIATHLTYLQA